MSDNETTFDKEGWDAQGDRNGGECGGDRGGSWLRAICPHCRKTGLREA
jgi:hypothetical protein